MPDQTASIVPELAFLVGYGCIVACQWPQAWRLLRAQSTAGVSPAMIVILIIGLALLQYALVARDQHPIMVIGNMVGLASAIITGWAYRRARGSEMGELRFAPTAKGRIAGRPDKC